MINNYTKLSSRSENGLKKRTPDVVGNAPNTVGKLRKTWVLSLLTTLMLLTGLNSWSQIALPYFENFSTITVANGFPTVAGGAWTRSGTTTNQPTYITNQSTYNRSGNGDTKFITFQYSSGTRYYFVGPFNLVGGTSYTASSLYKADGLTGFGPLELTYGTAAAAANQTNVIASIPSNIVNLSFNLITGNFTPSTSGSYYLAIKSTQNGNPWYLTLDDFKLEVTPTCIAPTSLVTSSVLFNSAVLGWTASSIPPSQGYEYEVRTSGAPGSGGAIASGSVGAGITSAAVSGLTSSTEYSFYVRGFCGGTDYSSWSSAGTFTTATPGQLGSGIGTNTFLPVYTCYGFNYSQQIYLASELNVALVPGSTYITKIRFKPSALSGLTQANFNNWTVYMGNTSKSSFTSATDWIPLGSMSQVYSSTLVTMSDGVWVELTLSSPFTWDGTSNLVVAVDENASNFSCTAAWASYTVPTTRGILYYSDSTNPNPASPPTASGTYSTIPQIQLVSTPVPSCLAPSSPTSSAVTSSSATISWAPASGLPVGYQYEVRTSGLPGSGSGGLTVSGSTTSPTVSANVSGLSANTSYQFYVRTDCGSGTFSEWTSAATFITPCLSLTTLFSESFDTAGTIPSCWTTSIVTGANSWQTAAQDGDASFSPHTGAAMAVKNWQSANSEALLISPPIDYSVSMPTNATRINVWIYRKTSNALSTDRIAFFVNTNPNLSGSPTTLLDISLLASQAPAVSSSGWYNYTANIPLSYNTGGNFYIIARGTTTSSFSSYSVGFDDFSIELVPSCNGVPNSGVASALVSSLCTSGSTTISATGYTVGNSSRYQWESSLDNFASAGTPIGTETSLYSNLNTGTITTTTSYRLKVFCSTDSSLVSYSTPTTVTINLPGTINPVAGDAICPGESATLEATASEPATFVWTAAGGYSESGSSVSVSPATTTVYTVTATFGSNCTASTTTTVVVAPAVTMNSVTSSVESICGSGSTTLTASASVASSANAYCSLSATSTSFEKIANVSLGSIANASSSTAGYEDFTSISTNIAAGVSVPFSINISTAYADDDRVFINIDLNQNGSFTDPGELLFSGAISTFCSDCSGAAATVTGSITVPVTALSGTTRMRIQLQDFASNTPQVNCGTYTFGQVEDYNVNITGGAVALTYSWSESGVGTTLTSTTGNPTTATGISTGKTYTVTATSDLGCSASGSVSVGVQPSPVVTLPTSVTICKGTGTTITIPETQNLLFSWSPAEGLDNTSSASVVANPIATTTYSVLITDTTTQCQTTKEITVVVNEPGTIVTQPVTAITSNGFGATFTVAGTPSVTYTYQWQRNGVNISDTYDSGTGTGNFSGTNTPTLTIYNAGASGQATNNSTYRCVLTPPSPCADLTSNSATLTVGNTGIVTNPQSVSLCLPTSTAQFSVVTNGNNPTSLVWSVSTNGGASYVNMAMYNIGTGVYSGPNTTAVPGLTIGMPVDPNNPALRDYRTIVVSGINGTTPNNLRFRVAINITLVSQPGILNISAPVSFDSNLSTAEVIRCTTPASGLPTNLSVTTAGTVSSVEWRYDTNPNGTFSNVVTNNTPAGATYVASASGNTYSLAVTTAATPAGNYYYKAFVNGAAVCGSITSNVATITVVNPAITVTPSTAAYCTPGPAVTLVASGSDINGYSWTASGFTTTLGTSISVTPTAATTYTVIGTDSNGCTNTAQATVTVGGAFALAATPAAATSLCEGGSVTLGAIPTQTGGASYLVNTVPYQFSASSGAFTPLVGGTPATSITATSDDTLSGSLPIGFAFNYGGTNYNNFRVSSNGLFTFNTTGSSTAANDLATTTTSARPGFAPLWDDLQCTAGITYQVSGVSPNRVLTVEWLNMEWNYQSTTAVISFQAKLYESTNAIEFVYRQDATAVNTASGGASIGLMGTATANYVSLQNSSANPTISTSSSTNTILAKPATGQIYRFTPATPVTYTYAWSSSPSGFTSASATPTVSPTVSSTYTVEATSSQGCKAQATTGVVNVIPTPVVTATNDGQPSATRCGFGKVTLTATGSAGSTLNWYTAATGGASVYAGENFLTPDLSSNTPYWVEASVNPGSTSLKTLGAGATTSSSPGSSPYYHGYGGQKAQYIIRATDLLAGGFTAGNLTSLAFEITSLGTGTLNGFNLAIGNTSQSSAVTNTAISGLTTVYSNASQGLTVGVNTYNFTAPFYWDGTSNLVVQVVYSNNNSGGSSSTVKVDSISYTSTLGIYADNATAAAVLAATSSAGLGSLSSNTTTSLRPFMSFGFQPLCKSDRVQVNAVVTPAPALALSSTTSTICFGESTPTVNITPATVGNYTSYTWSPADSVTGSSAAGYVFSPSATTVYTLTATEVGGCVNTATHTVTVNANPLVPVLAPITPICQGSTLNLIGSSATPTILSQNFESGLGTWVVTAGSTGGANPTVANFNVKAHGSTNSGSTIVTFNSPGGNSFLLADADGAGSGVTLNTQLTSPSFSTVGYSAVTLTFRHYHRYLTTAPTVQVSTNGGSNWTTVASYTADEGTLTNFVTATVSLNAYLGLPNVRVRYNYTGGWLWYWAIDDISITGTPLALSYAWSGPNGFTSAVQNPSIAGATPAASGTYTLEVTNSFGCKSSNTVDALVYPTPTAVAPANQLYYNGLATAAIPLSGTPSGVTFDISGGASVGLANATGITTIPSFIPVTGNATVSITPKANGCTGATVTYDIVVSAVNANPIANQQYCEGEITNAIPLSHTPVSLTGVTYTILGGASVGLADVSGVTSIPSFTAIPGSATITVIPQYGGVSGGAVTGTILVNPLPLATIAGSTAVCQNDASPLVTFTGSNGTAPYTFTYKLNGGNNQTVVSLGNTATIAQPTGTAGTFAYTLVSVKDSSSTTCTNPQSGLATIIVHPTPTAVAPANQSYYSGFATAAIPLTGTPSGVTFNISGGGASGLADVNGVTAIPSFIPTATPSTVTITPVANGCIGIPVTYQITFNPVVVNITSNICGGTNHGLNNQIQATSVSVPGYTVTGYQFEVTNTSTGEVSIVQNSQSHFKLTDASNYAYGTTFTIRVAAILNGNVQGYFGNTCSLTTTEVQTSRVVTAQCGATLVFINSTINANAVASTNLYRFRVALASAPTVTYLVERTVPNFKLTDVVGLPLLYNAEYLVDVQIRVRLAGFEAWSQYGVRCSIFTPTAPETSLITSQCEDYLVPSTTTQINAIAFPGASAYRFRLTGYDEFGDVNYVQIVTNASPSFTLSQFSGLTPGVTYTVAVAMELFGSFTDYGKDCSIITPSVTKQTIVEPFKATAYPNPFAANFMINVKTTSDSVIAIKVYDMVGRLVEQKSVTVAQLENAPIGDRYPSGVYNVVVTQDETVQTVRVVKR
ncbi:GEVED domain-containing protein [Flavobacterium sp.]|uniref:GEVED domain-containing protein n=1 Tax=Flavobacterium sp. TaxID=239 RepID=UPI00391B6D2F